MSRLINTIAGSHHPRPKARTSKTSSRIAATCRAFDDFREDRSRSVISISEIMMEGIDTCPVLSHRDADCDRQLSTGSARRPPTSPDVPTTSWNCHGYCSAQDSRSTRQRQFDRGTGRNPVKEVKILLREVCHGGCKGEGKIETRSQCLRYAVGIGFVHTFVDAIMPRVLWILLHAPYNNRERHARRSSGESYSVSIAFIQTIIHAIHSIHAIISPSPVIPLHARSNNRKVTSPSK